MCVGDRVELESSRVSVAGNVDEQARTRTQAEQTHARARQDQAVPFFLSPPSYELVVAVAVAGGGRRVGPDGGIGMGK